MEDVKRWIKDNHIIITAVAVWLLLEYMIQSTTGDEYAYQTALNGQSLTEYIFYYFKTWSNRILIDVVAVLILSKPMVLFKLINAVIFFLFLLGFKKLLVKGEMEKQDEKFLVSLFFIIPYTCFLDAGFSVTCIYYLWPMTAGIWSIYLIIKEKNSWSIKLLGAILLVFACNMEQTALLMNGILFLICCHMIMHKKIRIYPCAMFLLALGSILFMMEGEGGKHRVIVEIGNKFPEYIGLSVFQKFDLGLSTTMEHLVMESDPLWLIFVTLLFLQLIGKKSKKTYILAAVPFSFSLVFGVFKENLLLVYPSLKYMIESVGEYGVVDLNNYDLRNRWLALFFFFFLLITVIVDLYLVEDKDKVAATLTYIFGLGFLSRLIMGFSPTIYASGNRTYYPFWIVLICLSFHLFRKFDKQKKEEILTVAIIISLMALCSFVVALNR